MKHSEEYYRELAAKWADGSISPEEAKDYLDWYNADDGHPLEIPGEFASDRDALEQRVFARMRLEKPKRIALLRWAAAVIVLIAAGLYFITQPVTKREIAAGNTNNVQPGRNAATLILANGEKILLDTAAIGLLAQQSNATITGTPGQLVYNGQAASKIYNTLTTHKGQQFSLTLSDGTKVWLNAASSIRFPVSFTEDVRPVEISGEVYFDVARHASKPFYVKANGVEVKVLGTQFNINAYTDENTISTTLVEGAVMINGQTVLKPGQQASCSNGDIQLTQKADISSITAWKNGQFEFRHADIGTVMRQIARWYDIEVKYEGSKPKDRFNGGIPRTATLTELLSILRISRVNFRLEGKTLTVLP